MSHRLHWGRRNYKKEKIARSWSKTLQKAAESREYTKRRDLFWLSTALAATEKAGKIGLRLHPSEDFFWARKSLKWQVGEFVCKNDMCEAVSCSEMRGDVCPYESLLMREKVSLNSAVNSRLYKKKPIFQTFFFSYGCLNLLLFFFYSTVYEATQNSENKW